MIQAQIGDVIMISGTYCSIIGKVVSLSNHFVCLKDAVKIFSGFEFKDHFFSCYDKNDFTFERTENKHVRDDSKLGWHLEPYQRQLKAEIKHVSRLDVNASDIREVSYHPTRCKPFDCEEVVQEEAAQKYDFDGIIDALFHATQTLSNALSQSIPSSIGSRIRVNIAGEVYEGLVGSIRGSMFLLSAATKVYSPEHGAISAKVNDFWTHTCNVRTLRNLAKNEG